ncbi:hypothetical protein GOBAR_AA14847 [Gossypium barbadense]|uniref:Ribulose bisphosphate carboxylase/oxygenase activase, chloroplastic n=2 Tax=Gossypium TaxID=3633 RepID=A0A2P5XR05_GOSBA|nr:hypothetical protein GOBAR_AA14847 [Gossypium barbadense]
MSEDDERQQSPPSDLEFVSNKAPNCNATGSDSGHPKFQSTYPDQGKMSCLMINDIDAGLGRFGNTQMTVNNQIVVGTLMNLSDNPTRVSIGQDWRESDITNRVPIIVTGNDFSTIYAPLIRDGRMEKFYWQPTKEDIMNIVHRMYEKDGISKDEVVSIVDMDILISLVQAG